MGLRLAAGTLPADLEPFPDFGLPFAEDGRAWDAVVEDREEEAPALVSCLVGFLLGVEDGIGVNVSS